MSTKNVTLKEKVNGAAGNVLFPATTTPNVYDSAKSQALSQTLVNTPDYEALGFAKFSTATAYNTGDKVYKDNGLYRFIADKTAGEWDVAKVEPWSIEQEIEEVDDAIRSLIPAQASADNKLADKAYVNDKVSTDTATFRGTFNLVTDLELTTEATQGQIATALGTAISGEDKNDYAFVQIPTSDATPTEIARIDRYKYTGLQWAFEYSLNNSGFTAEQWAAINSGITSSLVAAFGAKYDKPAGGIPASDMNTNTFDDEPTVGSDNLVKSGGVNKAIGNYKKVTSATLLSNTSFDITAGRKYAVINTTVLSTDTVIQFFTRNTSTNENVDSFGNIAANGGYSIITATANADAVRVGYTGGYNTVDFEIVEFNENVSFLIDTISDDNEALRKNYVINLYSVTNAAPSGVKDVFYFNTIISKLVYITSNGSIAFNPIEGQRFVLDDIELIYSNSKLDIITNGVLRITNISSSAVVGSLVADYTSAKFLYKDKQGGQSIISTNIPDGSGFMFNNTTYVNNSGILHPAISGSIVELSGIITGTPSTSASNLGKIFYNTINNKLYIVHYGAYQAFDAIENAIYCYGYEHYLFLNGQLVNVDDTVEEKDYTKFFINNKYYTVNGNGTIVSGPSDSTKFACIKIPCKQGDKFKYRGIGATNWESTRAWAFINQDNEVIIQSRSGQYSEGSTSNENIVDDYIIITAPQNSKYLICHFNIDSHPNDNYLIRYSRVQQCGDFAIRENLYKKKFLNPNWYKTPEWETVPYTITIDDWTFEDYYTKFHNLVIDNPESFLEEINLSEEYDEEHPTDTIPSYISSITNGGMYAWHLKPLLSGRTGYDSPDGNFIKVLIVSGIHGQEKKSIYDVYYLMKQLAENYTVNREIATLRMYCDLWFIPLANPSGIQANTRDNANNINLNRDFPVSGRVRGSDSDSPVSPNSQYETRVLVDFIDNNSFNVGIDHHTSTGWYTEGGYFIQWGESRLPILDTLINEVCMDSTIIALNKYRQKFSTAFTDYYKYIFGYTIGLKDAFLGQLSNYLADKEILSATFEVIMAGPYWDSRGIPVFGSSDEDQSAIASLNYYGFKNFLLKMIQKAVDLGNGEVNLEKNKILISNSGPYYIAQ